MTNKDYVRLTPTYDEPYAADFVTRNRLRELENAIESHDLVFLPRLGQKIWLVLDFEVNGRYRVDVSEEEIIEIHINESYDDICVSVADGHGDIFSKHEWFLTKDEAEKRAEQLRQRGARKW